MHIKGRYAYISDYVHNKPYVLLRILQYPQFQYICGKYADVLWGSGNMNKTRSLAYDRSRPSVSPYCQGPLSWFSTCSTWLSSGRWWRSVDTQSTATGTPLPAWRSLPKRKLVRCELDLDFANFLTQSLPSGEPNDPWPLLCHHGLYLTITFFNMVLSVNMEPVTIRVPSTSHALSCIWIS